MGSTDGYGIFVILHDLAEKLGSGEHRNVLLHCGLELFIVRMYGCCVYDQIYVVCYVRCTLTDVDKRSHVGKLIGDFGCFHI